MREIRVSDCERLIPSWLCHRGSGGGRDHNAQPFFNRPNPFPCSHLLSVHVCVKRPSLLAHPRHVERKQPSSKLAPPWPIAHIQRPGSHLTSTTYYTLLPSATTRPTTTTPPSGSPARALRAALPLPLLLLARPARASPRAAGPPPRFAR